MTPEQEDEVLVLALARFRDAVEGAPDGEMVPIGSLLGGVADQLGVSYEGDRGRRLPAGQIRKTITEEFARRGLLDESRLEVIEGQRREG